MAILLLLFHLVAIPPPLQGQSPQSPDRYLGYELGSQFTQYHDIKNYFRHTAKNSPLVKVREYGESYEGRELLYAIVTTESNMDSLQHIRRQNLIRSRLKGGEMQNDNPAIVWLSYNIHGDEPASSEAAMKTLYRMANPENQRTKEWLRHTVVIIDPISNPDGRERYTQWYRQAKGAVPNPDPASREHHPPWPSGRTNHYYFDLNRDWIWGVQKETRQRINLYHQWMPQVHVDFHEQSYSDPYYFAPAAEPFHKAITEWQREIQHMIGKNHIKYFNDRNWLYFTRQVFDLYYPGYGDTYPLFNGAIGMTYEQGGGAEAGLAVTKPNGDTLTLKDRLLHHTITGLSTVEIAAEKHGKLVQKYTDYFARAVQNPFATYNTYVIKNRNPDKIRALADYLDFQEIAYGTPAETGTFRGYNYRTRENVDRLKVEENDLIISSYQPKSTLVRVLFQPNQALTDSLTYDITAWQLPYVYGLEAYALKDRLRVKDRSFSTESADLNYQTENPPYAYVLEWRSKTDLEVLAYLLEKGIKVRFSTKPFTIEDKSFGRGALIITRSDNRSEADRLSRIVNRVQKRFKQPVLPVQTGFVNEGADFGSDDVHFLKRPEAALVTGSPLSDNDIGEVWHFFDQQISYPLTLWKHEQLNASGMQTFDVIILPDGNYPKVFGDEKLEALREWVEQGGKLIAMEDAVSYLSDKKGFSIRKKVAENEPVERSTRERYSNRSRQSITSYNTGTVFRLQMDPTHPLAYGYGDTYYSLKLTSEAYELLDEGWNVGIIKGDAEQAHLSGFIGYKAEDILDHTLTYGVEHIGEGTVVYMVDNPLFRGFWHNGKLLFGNAVFLVGQ